MGITPQQRGLDFAGVFSADRWWCAITGSMTAPQFKQRHPVQSSSPFTFRVSIKWSQIIHPWHRWHRIAFLPVEQFSVPISRSVTPRDSCPAPPTCRSISWRHPAWDTHLPAYPSKNYGVDAASGPLIETPTIGRSRLLPRVPRKKRLSLSLCVVFPRSWVFLLLYWFCGPVIQATHPRSISSAANSRKLRQRVQRPASTPFRPSWLTRKTRLYRGLPQW